jgi:AhpD family alkylhydroperoxidase
MTKDYLAHSHELNENARNLAAACPEVMKAFSHSRALVYRSGKVDAKTKELIALVFGIAQRCDGCVTHHVKLAHRHGVTREELVEVLAVCLQMGGGPALAYAGEALAAFDQFAAAGRST